MIFFFNIIIVYNLLNVSIKIELALSIQIIIKNYYL
jgi:hypothetical protein